MEWQFLLILFYLLIWSERAKIFLILNFENEHILTDQKNEQATNCLHVCSCISSNETRRVIDIGFCLMIICIFKRTRCKREYKMSRHFTLLPIIFICFSVYHPVLFLEIGILTSLQSSTFSGNVTATTLFTPTPAHPLSTSTLWQTWPFIQKKSSRCSKNANWRICLLTSTLWLNK